MTVSPSSASASWTWLWPTRTSRAVVARKLQCESLIGAVYIDGGYEAARDLVQRAFKDRMDADLEPERDAKTAVQEWAQARAIPAPRYVEVARSGPAHQPQFVMQVELDGFDPMRGEASSKRAAEQAAAKAFLNRWTQP